MKRAYQFSFFKATSREFGGSLLVAKRKEKRPLSTKRPIHLVIKSDKASGELSFVNHLSRLEGIISKTAKRHHIKIYDVAINFNHIHFVISMKKVSDYKAWIRQVTAMIVRHLAKTAGKVLKDFFALRPYSRVLSWGRDLKNTIDYLLLNKLEVMGLRPPKKSTKRSAPA